MTSVESLLSRLLHHLSWSRLLIEILFFLGSGFAHVGYLRLRQFLDTLLLRRLLLLDALKIVDSRIIDTVFDAIVMIILLELALPICIDHLIRMRQCFPFLKFFV